MKVQVIKFNNLNEVLKTLEALMMGSCKNVSCNCRETELFTEPRETPIVDINYFLYKLADKKGCKIEELLGWLNSLSKIYPIAAFNIMLREIAVYLDHKYEDHIENSERIFAISPLDGRIHELNKKHIKNYRNFAAFRTIEDAKFACNILRRHLKDMFKVDAKNK